MLVTIRQLAQRYQVSTRTIWRMVKRGALPHPVRFNRKLVRWRESDLPADLRAGALPLRLERLAEALRSIMAITSPKGPSRRAIGKRGGAFTALLLTPWQRRCRPGREPWKGLLERGSRR
jgi:predicted DNA-binding transcriptional regulator AlpA